MAQDLLAVLASHGLTRLVPADCAAEVEPKLEEELSAVVDGDPSPADTVGTDRLVRPRDRRPELRISGRNRSSRRRDRSRVHETRDRRLSDEAGQTQPARGGSQGSLHWTYMRADGTLRETPCPARPLLSSDLGEDRIDPAPAYRLVPQIPGPPGVRIRLVINTDAANEIDDLYAIAPALRSPDRFEIAGFVATHFAPAHFGSKIDGNRTWQLFYNRPRCSDANTKEET